jgi:hypothetical protein
MRKTYIFGVAFASVLALAACGGNAQKSAPAANDTNAAAPAEEAPANATDENEAAADEAGAGEAQGQGQAGSRQDFNIVNNTGHTVMTLNVSPSDSNQWGPDILGTGTLPNGQQGEVTFARGQEQCSWDLRATFDDGSTGDWRGVNLCQTTTVTLTPS